jgi:hypothetical protein
LLKFKISLSPVSYKVLIAPETTPNAPPMHSTNAAPDRTPVLTRRIRRLVETHAFNAKDFFRWVGRIHGRARYVAQHHPFTETKKNFRR